MPKTRNPTKTPSAHLLTRDRSKLIVVYGVTIVCLYLCYRLAQPFVPALVFAITVAIVTQPFMRWLDPRIKNASLRAGAAVSVVSVVILGPISAMVYFVAIEIAHAVQNWHTYLEDFQALVDRQPRLASAWQQLSENLDLTGAIERLAVAVNAAAMAVVSGSVQSLFQALVMLYVLFFIFRDRDYFIASVKKLSPLTTRETNRLLQRLSDTIHATIFGVIAVAIIQGTLGGIIFALLGIPGAILWASVMAVFAMIPNLGTFIVWGPAALFLVFDGHPIKAIILVAWGLTAIGMIDNLIYPYLVGNRLRTHTLIAFLSILGGLALFGPTGIILGPVVVNLTVFLLQLWRRRTERPAGNPEPSLS
jgi:predicted PurR-regulated permease PerM